MPAEDCSSLPSEPKMETDAGVHNRRVRQREGPHVRNRRSVANLNTLTYILTNLRALTRVCSINAALLKPFRQ